MDDFLEFEADKKTIRTISLEEFSVEDLHQYIKELKKEIERTEKELIKKNQIQQEAKKYFK
tara:strand:+ start:328 stop:510 length:183 start_codon:yes stop_codon:yes gene_type:complete